MSPEALEAFRAPAWLMAIALAFYLGAKAVLAIRAGQQQGPDTGNGVRILTLVELLTQSGKELSATLQQVSRSIEQSAEAMSRNAIEIAAMKNELAPAIQVVKEIQDAIAADLPQTRAGVDELLKRKRKAS